MRFDTFFERFPDHTLTRIASPSVATETLRVGARAYARERDLPAPAIGAHTYRSLT
jgi:hypothetical protein